jgi:hypothetical protein
MALQIITLCDSISKLSVDGVTIMDIDAIPTADLRKPVLFPEPVGFVSNFSMVRNSQGGGSVALMTVEYDLNYTFCYSPVGSLRTGLGTYGPMVDKAFEILDAIIAIDEITGAVDLTPGEIPIFGVVADPSGNQYNGCKLTVHVMEFVN